MPLELRKATEDLTHNLGRTPTEAELATLVLTAPMMPGAEYLTSSVLRDLWADMATATRVSVAAAGTDLQAFLKALNPAWNLVGRVHFNLAENRRDRMVPVILHSAHLATASAIRPPDGVALGLRRDDLLLEAGQQQLPFGQGQP